MNFLRKLITHKFFLFALLFLGGIVLFAPQVLAQGDTFGINKVGGLLPLGGEDIRVIIAKIIRIFLGLLGIIAVGLMLYAGFTWMTSGGNEEKIASAKKILINATIGLAIIMSSFAITQFILKSLSDVTGSGDANNGGVNGGPVGACENFADCQANGGGAPQCGDGDFVVKSLTPRTPNNNGTGMTNTVVRAVFSRPLDPGQNPNQIFRLTSGGNPVAVRNVRILNGRQIAEAYFERNTALCNAGDERGCLTPGEYTIEVNPELRADGVVLKTRLSCGDFDNKANFNINQDFLDNQPPAASSVTFNGRRAGANVVVGRNAKYRLNATFEDRKRNPQNVAFGGISYTHLRVESQPRDADGERVDWSYYDGPRSGSNEAFSFGRELVFASNTPAPALYNLTFTFGDIDSNRSVATSSFILVGELCNNGRQDPGETGVDIGGLCLGDGQCNADWQCIAGECGADGRCVNKPVIKNVDVGGADPDAWDGAPGSWATIVGNFFGEQVGEVQFGVDNNNDGTVDQWIGAPFANCNGIDVWSDRQIIVEIPNIPDGTSTTIRVRTPAVGDKPGAEDLSTDEHGPKSGPYEGIFKISQNSRPGLCAVLGPNNTNMASSSVLVSAFGRALGNGQDSTLLFGGVAAPIRQWGDQTILSSVPQNMRAGRVGVRAKIGETYTNGVEFIVIDRDANVIPQVVSVSPYPTSTRGSLITLNGAGFGAHGTVYMAATQQAAVACAETDVEAEEAACKRLDLLTLPDACGNTWNDKQIIGKIPPEDFQLGQYFFAVKNDAGYHSDGAREITVVDGPPLPGLCRLEPNSGVAPLAEDAEPLSLVGVNLNPNPELYFWSVGSNWLISSRDRDPQGENVIRSVAANGTNIRTMLPIGDNGVSMITGPILARVAGNFSNGIQYTVNDCTVGGNPPGPNYQCCTTGPERGVWKPAGLACAGETRSAGYIWRFTTGLIPQVPRVLEACNVEEWNDLSVENFVRPSPSPWQNWNVGDACTDSVITVQFNMRMSEADLDNQVKIYTCGQGASPDCSYDQQSDVTANYRPTFLAGQTDVLEMRLAPGATHAAGTWHRVILGNNLRANEPGLVEFNQNRVNTTKLSIQRPLENPVNGITVAYNFDFKTGANRCSLFGAAITPPTYTAHLLGVVQNTAFPISTNFDNPPYPFYFYVWGRGKQACSVIDVNGQGWQWKPVRGSDDPGHEFAYTTKSDNAEDQGVASTSPDYYKDIRATATALQNTLLEPVLLTARTTTIVDGVQKEVVGTSQLFIQLGDPTVTEWWPECSESCTNATIGVKFNLPMMTSTYRTANGSAIRIEKCLGLGENCEDTESVDDVDDVNAGAFDPFEYAVTIPGNLDLGTLYQVTITDQILSFGGTLNGQTIVGKPLVPKVWKFRTKMRDGICILDKVDVLPSPYVANLVGQKTPYAATPLSSPNQCSSLGQRLNPWAYGWNWSVQNEQVASITDFSTKGTPPGFCSTNCLPTGSDIPLGQTAFTCGNGEVDPGEDCDIALPGERPGISCSLSCLRPGNTNATTTANPLNVGLCGNGALEPNVGEECDPGIPGLRDYCTNTCTWKGSDNKFTGEVNDLQCGNGFIGLGQEALANLGEDCDTGITLEEATAQGHPEWSRFGCSNTCLHTGTRLARSYCEDPDTSPEQKQSAACYNAITICGNGELEPGEECERNPNENRRITVFGPNGVPAIIDVPSATSTCSNRCVLKNACAFRNLIHSDFTCEAGTPGCNEQCVRLGSSPLYEPASLCGDGATGIGENPRCEPADLAQREGNDQDPVQIVTAVGRAEPNPDTLMQETTISAQATQVKESAVTTTPLRDKNIVGVGNYALQCGFVEYPEPRVNNGVVSANNCPDQTQGVDKNSCCQPRPTRVAEYPVHGTGIGNNNLVCQNTFISADFDHEIDPASVENAVRIASLHPAGHNCAQQNEVDITADVNTLLAFSGEGNVGSQGVLARMWEVMKEFFASIFDSVVHAQLGGNLSQDIEREVNGKVWCTGKTSTQNTVYPKLNEDGTPNGSTVSVVINDLLDPGTTYAVIFRGGNAGIKDVGGVSIRGQGVQGNLDKYYKDDIFLFKTSNQICKIASVSVDPANHLFTTPTTTRQFRTVVKSTNGGPIVSTPSYAWEWNWEPQNNSLFRLGPPVNTSAINISSTGLEGNLIAAAQATITEDRSEVGKETGKIYVGLTDLTSSFCENPWPSQALYPYEDRRGNNDNFNQATNRFDGRSIPGISLGGKTEYLNFSFGYCADSGVQGRKDDDLPLLQPVVQGENLAPASACSITGAACNRDADCPDVRVRGQWFFRAQHQTCKPGQPVAGNQALPPGTLKKFLLFSDKNDDVIGVQVFENPGQLSARDWFQSKGFSGIERYKDIVVDGYTGMSDGNNIYISALNELSDKRVHSYIYLFGINENAQTNTKQVLDKIMRTLKFNINLPERNNCIRGNGVSGGQYLPANLENIAVTSLVCTSDYACRNEVGVPTSTSNGLCANAKTKFQSDWKRLNLVRDIQGKLETFKTANNGQYPSLQAGTYIPGYTNSHWPSWNRLLEAIGPVGQPPLNEWAACGRCSVAQGGRFTACATDADCGAAGGTCVLPDDQQTCWHSADASFSCPLISNVLEYKSTSNSAQYELYLPLEYFNIGVASQKEIIARFASTSRYNSIASCGLNGVEVLRPAAGNCGNGVRDAGEQCDPAGSSVAADGQLACPDGQSAFKTCNERCQYTAPVCRPAASCGNGRIEGQELCDDGNLNGSYGHCSRNCTPPQQQNRQNPEQAGYCGDQVRNFNDINRNGNQDAGEGFVEQCDKAQSSFQSFGFCEFNLAKECVGNWDSFLVNGTKCEINEGDCISKNDPTYHITPQFSNGTAASCSADCQSVGGFCGDGQFQRPFESCDDGNRNNLDGCSSTCQEENIACVRAVPNGNIQTVNGDTHIIINYPQNPPASCNDTNGDSICRGLGLSCEDVLAEQFFIDIVPSDCQPMDFGCNVAPQRVQRFEYQSMGLGILSRACERDLSAEINKNVKVQCNGIPANAPAAAAVVGSCGNGAIDNGEVCDTGANNNGRACTPEYGRTCSYCSADCREVLTVDPVAACGNGKIDVDGRIAPVNGVFQPEVCDINPQTNQVITLNAAGVRVPAGSAQAVYQVSYNLNSVAPQCADQGTYACENNCQQLVNNCVNCGTSDGQGKPIPKLAVLNVLTPRNNQLHQPWKGFVDRNLIRLNAQTNSGVRTLGGSGGWGSKPVGVHENDNDNVLPNDRWRQYVQGYNTGNHMNQNWILATMHGYPLDRGYGFRTSSNQNGPWSNTVREFERGVESNLLCRDQYALYFNLIDATEELGGQPDNVSAVLNAAGAKGQYERYGSFFPYPVNGEVRAVQNEYVLSPAVPQGTFRVVVKWKNLPDNDVTLAPVIYNRDFLSAAQAQNLDPDVRLQSTISYSRALAERFRAHPGANLGVDPTWVCTMMAQHAASGYWLPNDCIPFNYRGSAQMGQGDLQLAKSGGIYVHYPGQLSNTKAMAMTVFTGNYVGNPSTGAYNSPYAVFIEAISNEDSLPISAFDNLDITVEVYDYRAGQLPDASLFQPRPTNVFTMRSARSSSNDGGIVKYWHAFNLVKDQSGNYQIRQIADLYQNGESYRNGAMVTNFADVLCRVPGENCNRDQ